MAASRKRGAQAAAATAPEVTTAVVPLREQALGGGLEGAARTSRETADWSVEIISPDDEINTVKDDADARSFNLVANDGFAMGALHTHRDSIVGSQFRLNAQPEASVLGAADGWAEEFQEYVESRFNLLADSPENYFDASGVNSFTEMVRLAVGGFLFTGEILGTVEWIRQQGRPFNTAIQMVAPARLDNPDGQLDTDRMRKGVEKDQFGKAIAYHIRVKHPGDLFAVDKFQFKRVEAFKPWGRRQVIHIIDQLRPDQTRGIADMVAVLKTMRMTRKFQDIILQNAVVNATYAASIESELPREMVFSQLGAGQNAFGEALGSYMKGLMEYIKASENVKIDGVKVPHLYPGTKFNLQPMGTPGGVGTDFESSLLRHTATALGLSYEEFTRDYTKTNYSSARATMGQTWKYMQSRKKISADKFASYGYALWLEEEIAKGDVPLPTGKKRDIFYDPLMREALCQCSWLGAARGQIDELKETQAAIMRINGGLSTYEAEIGQLGKDFRKVFAQRARENKLMNKLGLEFSAEATKPGKNDAQQTMTEKESEQENG